MCSWWERSPPHRTRPVAREKLQEVAEWARQWHRSVVEDCWHTVDVCCVWYKVRLDRILRLCVGAVPVLVAGDVCCTTFLCSSESASVVLPNFVYSAFRFYCASYEFAGELSSGNTNFHGLGPCEVWRRIRPSTETLSVFANQSFRHCNAMDMMTNTVCKIIVTLLCFFVCEQWSIPYCAEWSVCHVCVGVFVDTILLELVCHIMMFEFW